MAYNYIIPRVAALPPGYNCHIIPPVASLGDIIIKKHAFIRSIIRIWFEGKLLDEVVDNYEFKNGRIIGNKPKEYIWDGTLIKDTEKLHIIEIEINSLDNTSVFKSKMMKGFYAICMAPNKKSFNIGPSLKMSSPAVINLIARHHIYVETCPVIHIDRSLDQGTSLVTINPYNKVILYKIHISKDVVIFKGKIPPRSALRIDMSSILPIVNDCWLGPIQITANNRFIIADYKHSISDPTNIYGVEHLETFRAEKTFLPAFRKLRQFIGIKMREHGIKQNL